MQHDNEKDLKKTSQDSFFTSIKRMDWKLKLSLLSIILFLIALPILFALHNQATLLGHAQVDQNVDYDAALSSFTIPNNQTSLSLFTPSTDLLNQPITKLPQVSSQLQSAMRTYQTQQTNASLLQMVTLAKNRYILLENEINTNPSLFLNSVLPGQIRQTFPEQVQPFLEQNVQITGDIQYSHGDNFTTNTDIDFYSICQTNGTCYRLHFPGTVPDDITPDENITIQSVAIGADVLLPDSTNQASTTGYVQSYHVNKLPTFIKPKKDQKLLVILIGNFNSPVVGNTGLDSFWKKVMDEVVSFYKQNSYGKVSITYELKGWYNTTSQMSCKRSSWWDNVTAGFSADANGSHDYQTGVNAYVAYQKKHHLPVPKDYTGIIVVFTPTSKGASKGDCDYAGMSFGIGPHGSPPQFHNIITATNLTGFKDVDTKSQAVAHEIGHGLGINHASTLICKKINDFSNCASVHLDEYGDIQDVMGMPQMPELYNVAHKVALGWITSKQVKTVTTSGVYDLHQFDTFANETMVLRIKKSDTSNLFYYIEYRKYHGLLLHLWNEEAQANTALIPWDLDGANPFITIGENITDSVNHIKITLIRYDKEKNTAYVDVKM